jgi:radical SAM superfamily enzyme YgiQ (UPF0313 family)
MRILLIQALNAREYVQTVFPGLGLAYLASYLKARIPEVELRIIQGEVGNAVSEFKPQIVGISSVTQNWPIAREIARGAKESGALVVVGGAHITALPGELDENMDVGVLGEGEITLVTLVRSFDPRTRTIRNLEAVPGIVYLRTGQLATTQPALHVEPLDDLPFPDRRLLDLPRHGVVHLFSSRGCPYRCTFCFSSRYWGKPRYFSPGYVLRELAQVIAEHAPTRIFFFDDLFLVPKDRFRMIARDIIAAGYHRKVEFDVNCRANLVDDETADLLKEMNVATANLGFESASEATLKYLKGGSVTVQQNWDAVRTLRKRGIKVSGTFIIGSPRETREEILETLEFVRKSGIHFLETYILTPLPGTPIWRHGLDRGLVFAPMDWRLLDQESDHHRDDRVILSEVLTRDELYDLYDRFRRLKTRKHMLTWALSALRQPQRIPRFLLRHASMAWHRNRR